MKEGRKEGRKFRGFLGRKEGRKVGRKVGRSQQQQLLGFFFPIFHTEFSCSALLMATTPSIFQPRKQKISQEIK